MDLFAGCGGLSLGLMAAGWKGVLAVEKDPMAYATLDTNLVEPGGRYRFDWPKWLPRAPQEIGAFVETFGRELKGLEGEIELVAGGPPCQGFSFAGRRDPDDLRNQLFRHFLAVVDQLHPKMVLIENVSGITVGHRTRGGSEAGDGEVQEEPPAFSELIQLELRRLGYYTYGSIVRAEACGVPQRRPRFFIVGIRTDLSHARPEIDPFQLIEPARVAFLREKGLGLDRAVTVGEAISDLEMRNGLVRYETARGRYYRVAYYGPETHYQRLLRQGMPDRTPPDSLRLPNHRLETQERFHRIIETCRPGVSLSAADKERLGGIRKHTLVLLNRDGVSHTLTTLPDDLVHYEDPRILTVREMARLQSFPDWWEFKGKYTTGGASRTKEAPRYTQVGNAVAPFVAELLGRVLRQVLQNLEDERPDVATRGEAEQPERLRHRTPRLAWG